MDTGKEECRMTAGPWRRGAVPPQRRRRRPLPVLPRDEQRRDAVRVRRRGVAPRVARQRGDRPLHAAVLRAAPRAAVEGGDAHAADLRRVGAGIDHPRDQLRRRAARRGVV
eukprot:gene3354-biopygen2713